MPLPFLLDDKEDDLQQEMGVNSTIGPIERRKSNLEAEVNELVVKPDMSGLYRILGKPHSKGGTPLNLEENSFIFSNEKSLAINKAEKKLLEIKDNVTKAKHNTPAKLLSRVTKPKDYNDLISVLQNDKSDDIAKQSATLMLQKHIQNMGKIAYLQESKKDEQAPDFSSGTAPVYDAKLKDTIDQQEQYMYGGTFQQGGRLPKLYPSRPGEVTPTGVQPKFGYPGGLPALADQWQGAGISILGVPAAQAQGSMYDWALQNNPDLIQGMWDQYGMTLQGKAQHIPDSASLQDKRAGFVDNKFGVRMFAPQRQMRPTQPSYGVQPLGATPPNPYTRNAQTDNIKQSLAPNQFNGTTTIPYNPSVPLSPLQKLNLLYAGTQALTVPKFNPMRPQVQSPLVELEKLNPQTVLNQVDNSTYQAYAGNNITNPVLAAANNSDIYGRSLDAKSQALGNVLNQNVQIGNQQNLTNNQIQRQDMQQNTQFNFDYYNNQQRSDQNYANEKRFAGNQAFSLFNQYESDNANLNTALQSQRLFTKPLLDAKGNQVYDKNGKAVMQQLPLYDVNNNGLTPSIYYTGAGGLDQLPNKINTGDFFNERFQYLISQGVDPNKAAIIVGKLSGDKEALQYSVHKMGGKVKRMRK